MPGIEILAGVVAGEAVHQIGSYLDDSDEEIRRYLGGEEVTKEDIRKDVEIASRDRGKVEQIAMGLRSAIDNSGAKPEKVQMAHRKVDQMQQSPTKVVGS